MEQCSASAMVSCCNKPGRVIWVNWTAPEANWFKLNTDGASKGNPGPAGSGGLIRDSYGNWVSGFVCNIGVAPAIDAELCAIKLGLRLAWNIGIRNLILETDSTVALSMIRRTYEGYEPHNLLVCAIRELLDRDWTVQLQHVYREGNSSADCLANYSLHFGLGITTILPVPLPGLLDFLQSDMIGVSKPRVIKDRRQTALPPRLIRETAPMALSH